VHRRWPGHRHCAGARVGGDVHCIARGTELTPNLMQTRRLAPGCVCLVLDRPEHRNALNADLIAQLTASIRALDADEDCRVILITGSGSVFCAGVDLNAMREHGSGDPEENLADAQQLAGLMLTLHCTRKPTVAIVNGAAIGAGVGLVVACDVAICSTTAKFRLPEVQLGIVPAVISPYLVAAMGPRVARRFCLTGEVLEPPLAHQSGVVHVVVDPDKLADTSVQIAQQMCRGGPDALSACKRLFDEVTYRPIDEELAIDCARSLAMQRATPEGQEGITAALLKRSPGWSTY
jgi:methylglutaconyl-CoA hydratase